MTDEGSPPIEIIADEGEDESVRSPPARDWHRPARTVAAIVAALALLWTATSVAGMRANSDRQECRQALETRRWMLEEEHFRDGGNPAEIELPEDVVDDLIGEARSCDLDDLVELLELRYRSDDEDAEPD